MVAGEFALMNYRISAGFRPPFRVYVAIDEDGSSQMKAYVTLKVKSEIPKEHMANGLEVELPMPKSVERVNCEVGRKVGQMWDWNDKTRKLLWRFKTMRGGEDGVLKVRATLDKVCLVHNHWKGFGVRCHWHNAFPDLMSYPSACVLNSWKSTQRLFVCVSGICCMYTEL